MVTQKDFYFYSTERGASVTPETLDPAPATLVKLDQPPIFGSYDFDAGNTGRGSVIPTLGGNVIQDFGVVVSDGRISFSETDAPFSAANIAAIKAIHDVVDAQYFFTDGFSAWTVQFLRPNGFKYRQNLLWTQHGESVYSYEINLIVIEKSI